MNLDMNQLRAFVTVAELRSFSRASHRLCRVQSAISQQIQKLERSVGAVLFVRGGRTLELTAQGEQLLAYALKILAWNDVAVTELTEVCTARVVRIGTSDTYATCHLPHIVKTCAQRLPSMEIEVHCDYSGALWRRYRAGELDIVLTQDCPADISAQLLYSQPLVWVVARQSNVFERETVPLALFTQGCGDRALVLDALNRTGKPYRIGYHGTSHAGVIAALSTGCYVSAVLPSSADPNLRVLDEAQGFPPLGSLDISLACREKSHNALIGLFAEVSRSYFHRLNATPSSFETHSAPIDAGMDVLQDSVRLG